jgi:hypothetical protein
MPLPESLRIQSKGERKAKKMAEAGERAKRPAKQEPLAKRVKRDIKGAVKFTAKFLSPKLRIKTERGGYGNVNARRQAARDIKE